MGYLEKNNMGKINSILKRGDVVLCDLGFGEGSEQSGLRPCVIIQNNVGNKYSPTVIVATITSSTTKAKLPTHIEIDERSGLDKPSVILCEQIRTIDKNRIRKFIGSIPRDVREKINTSLIASMEIFRKGEIETINQSSRVSAQEDMIIKCSYIDSNSLEIMIDIYKKELITLENMCRLNRLYIENYYNKSEEMEKILSNNEIEDKKPTLRVV